jgi:hypothetical protein
MANILTLLTLLLLVTSSSAFFGYLFGKGVERTVSVGLARTATHGLARTASSVAVTAASGTLSWAVPGISSSLFAISDVYNEKSTYTGAIINSALGFTSAYGSYIGCGVVTSMTLQPLAFGACTMGTTFISNTIGSAVINRINPKLLAPPEVTHYTIVKKIEKRSKNELAKHNYKYTVDGYDTDQITMKISNTNGKEIADIIFIDDFNIYMIDYISDNDGFNKMIQIYNKGERMVVRDDTNEIVQVAISTEIEEVINILFTE